MGSAHRQSNCSSALSVDVYWHARPEVYSQAAHLDLITDALMGLIKQPSGRRWNPYNEAITRSEFRARLLQASRGQLIPTDHVKSILHPLAAEMFEIRWQNITVTCVAAETIRHEDIQVRLLHAEPGSLGVVALILHGHEKVIVDGDKRATREAQDAEILTAVQIYGEHLPSWERRLPAPRLDTDRDGA